MLWLLDAQSIQQDGRLFPMLRGEPGLHGYHEATTRVPRATGELNGFRNPAPTCGDLRETFFGDATL